MSGGLALTATFVADTIPNSIAFTAPAASVILSNGAVQISGTITNVPSPPLTLTCQVFFQSNLSAATPALTTTGTSNWTFSQSGLVAGNYIAAVMAVDVDGNGAVISEDFTATVDTNKPAILVTSPAPNALFAENNPIVVNGTASDSVVPLSYTISYLVPQTTDGITPNGGAFLTANGVGTSNWSATFTSVPPGVYQLYANAVDAAGNVGVETNILLTNTAILINGSGSVSLLLGANLVTTNPIGYPLQANVTYTVKATPATGQKFLCWSENGATATNATQTFVMEQGIVLTANFVPVNAGSGISFSSPAANARLSTNSFTIKGRTPADFGSARIGCWISSLSTGYAVGPLMAATTSRTWSVAVTNLPPDNYVLLAEATNTAGATATISERIFLLPFLLVAGTYDGLFITTNAPVSPTNSGSLIFTVAPSGVFTGKILFPAYAPVPIYPLAFENNNFTVGTAPLALTGFHGENWSGVVEMDLTGSNDYAIGTIASAAWSAQLICYRTVDKLSAATIPAAAKYSFGLQSDGQTNGIGTNGFISLVAGKNGVLNVSGGLPDNTSFSGSTRVSEEGYWPLCAIPAGDAGKGMILGWGNFTNASNSVFYWFKQPRIGSYYTGGVGLTGNDTFSLIGTNYTPPVPGSQYSIVFDGGAITTPVTNFLAVNTARQFVASGGPSDQLKISLSANGVLTGAFLYLNSDEMMRFKGVFVSPVLGGSGYISEGNLGVGGFQVQP